MIKRAHHVSFAISDLDRSRAFYGDLLGMVEIERPDFQFPGIWYQAGDVQVHLMVAPGEDAPKSDAKPDPIHGHAAFEIEDYDAAKSRLETEGLQVLGLGAEVGQLFVTDPDGNTIELIVPGGRLGRSPR